MQFLGHKKEKKICFLCIFSLITVVLFFAEPPLSPLPVQNTETISNGTNERRTMRFYPNTFGNGGGQNKRTASTEPSAIW